MLRGYNTYYPLVRNGESREGRGYFFYWLVFLVFFFVLSFLTFHYYQPRPSAYLSQAVTNEVTFFKYILKTMKAPLLLMVAIWLKNLAVTVFILLLGGYLWGVFSYLVIGMNAVLIGALVKEIAVSGVRMSYILSGLWPHGIVELPTIFLSCAIAVVATRRRFSVLWRLINGLKYIAPLLLLAAAIETFVTPVVLSHFH